MENEMKTNENDPLVLAIVGLINAADEYNLTAELHGFQARYPEKYTTAAKIAFDNHFDHPTSRLSALQLMHW